MKKRIAIDMDETVADCLKQQITWYYNEFGIQLSHDDMRGKKLHEVVPQEHIEKIRSFFHHPDFFRDLDVFTGAVEVIAELSKDYDIFFASSAMEFPSSFTAKYQWLKMHFPFINDMNFIFCGFKGILNCDYLIDDSPRHIDVFQGQGLLFNACHNLNEKGYIRVHNWHEIKEKLSNDENLT